MLVLQKLFKLAEINLHTEKKVLKFICSWDKSIIALTTEYLLLLVRWTSR